MCYDPSTNVHYQLHEEHTGRGTCVRCGAVMDEALAGRWQRYHAALAEYRSEEEAWLRFERGSRPVPPQF